ncbi:MAG: hypothetical protein WC332_00895 [Clostridia bacterium]|jgi:hypothetical protein
MSTLTLRPTGDGAVLTLTCSAGSDHYALVDEAVADDGDYVYTTGNGKDYYLLTNHTTETESISKITIYARLKKAMVNPANGITAGIGVVVSGSEYLYSVSGVTESWVEYSRDISLNPTTSAAWTWTDIDNLSGIVFLSLGELSGTAYCSHFYVVVTSLALPTIDTFTADPESLINGNAVTLTWTSTDGTSASISPTVGATTVDGTIDLYPTVTTTYTLTVTNASGSDTSDVTVTIQLPSITSFTADPENMEFGTSSQLAWETVGADSVTLSQGIGNVGSSGTKIVNPVETTSYTLAATNTSGTTYDYATVTVIPTNNSYLKATAAANYSPDYGRLQQMSKAKTYLEFSSDLTEHYVKSIGYNFPAGDFKRPYLSTDYNSMVYLFDDTPTEVSVSIKETALSKVLGETPDRNDMYFDFSSQLASKDNFNAYARENYRLMGKTVPTASMRFGGAIESIYSDVGVNIPSGEKANLSIVSPRYSGDKYLWSGRVKDGIGDWGSFSRYSGLTVIYYTPELTANQRYVIISLMSGGKTLTETELMVWYKG